MDICYTDKAEQERTRCKSACNLAMSDTTRCTMPARSDDNRRTRLQVGIRKGVCLDSPQSQEEERLLYSMKGGTRRKDFERKNRKSHMLIKVDGKYGNTGPIKSKQILEMTSYPSVAKNSDYTKPYLQTHCLLTCWFLNINLSDSCLRRFNLLWAAFRPQLTSTGFARPTPHVSSPKNVPSV